ncbi:primosome assembly protein PriA [Bifidobacterium asteroides DSM 20089]|uniref:Primosome assembly protein PriA n=1 Tax=Bifidobacterium asteroides DSM 20089 TaxID=1437594 RepID=A0AAD0AB61_9BIFI|nr:primosome assembly protein PriA [Bifidobacterium asteroides]AFU71691.1 primosome assembly protein PriA [Bifidobacterium asteroides PRL2011]ATO41535.1 primosome assembly protein PriA [Bifidobacterium asteroides DSM 20089]
MDSQEVSQPALDGLAPRRRSSSSRKKPPRRPADELPVARVVLDVQATHLGGTFDYLVDADQDGHARPGCLVRVRFGARRVNGIIWARVADSQVSRASLRFLERVVLDRSLISPSLRADITAIARAYGGTEANILRLALPPRVARIDKEQQLVPGQPRLASDPAWVAGLAQRQKELKLELDPGYQGLEKLDQSLEEDTFAAYLTDILPGMDQAALLAARVLIEALLAGRSAVMVLPGIRQVAHLSAVLQQLGLHPFGPPVTAGPGHQEAHGWSGDFAILDSGMAPAERYRAYLALASGQVRCAIGLRAAMYAPVEGPALFALMDDASYQYADGMMPYANARGVLRLRARAHGGVFLAMGRARSVRSHWESLPEAIEADSGVTGPGTALPLDRSAVTTLLPWIRWLNREELSHLADPTIGARVPHTAVAVINKALERGPVLLSIPQDGIFESLSCARCHHQARCSRCTGPLRARRPGAPRCAWCGAAATDWSCPDCGGSRLRVVRVGAAGTAQELRMLFRNVPIVISSASQPRGVVERVQDRPSLVIATPGAEPRVVGSSVDGNNNNKDTGDSGLPRLSRGYRAVAILDAWTSLYAPGVDARMDTLGAWMRVASFCRPRSKGGQVLLLGECDPQLAQALMTWQGPVLAAADLEDRRLTAMPPAVGMAAIWGEREAVIWMLDAVGIAPGQEAVTEVGPEPVPALLGPVPIPAPSTLKVGYLEGTQDRVRALVRVPTSRRDKLADDLKQAQARYVAGRGRGELRFRMDPKDLT